MVSNPSTVAVMPIEPQSSQPVIKTAAQTKAREDRINASGYGRRYEENRTASGKLSKTYGSETQRDNQTRTTSRYVSASYQSYLGQRQRQISRQLLSALAGVDNFRLLDKNHSYQHVIPKDARGPYKISVEITEASEEIVSESSRIKIPLVYRGKEGLVQGVIGLDVTVTDPRSGAIILAFPVQGTYISQEQERSTGFIADVTKSNSKVKSTIDQALRAALNEAARKLNTRLNG